MRSFFVTYRWELWLVVGIPVIQGLMPLVVGAFAHFLGHGNEPIGLLMLVGSVVGLLLLAVSYLRVRNLGRDFLAVLWGYVVVASVIGTIASGASFLVGVVFPAEEHLTAIGRGLSIYGLATLLDVLALLWFARRASRLSLMHAFFLVVYSTLPVFGPVTGATVEGINPYLVLASSLVGRAITLTVMLAKVWLLGNLDRRSPRFRRNAVIGLIATSILSGYAGVVIADLIGYAEGPYLTILPLLGVVVGLAAFTATSAFGLAVLLMLFALVYLVRVRPLTAYAEPESEAPTAATDEGR